MPQFQCTEVIGMKEDEMSGTCSTLKTNQKFMENIGKREIKRLKRQA
jgi:hypothetical protein